MTTTLTQALDALEASMLASATSPSDKATLQQEFYTFQSNIDSNATLVAALNADFADGALNGFAWVTQPMPNIGADEYSGAFSYSDNKNMIVGSKFMQELEPPNNSIYTAEAISAFVGHENQHAFDSSGTDANPITISGIDVDSQAASNNMSSALENYISENPNASTDLTSYDLSYTDVNYADEASAYITGYNDALYAWESQMQITPGATLSPAQLQSFQSSYPYLSSIVGMATNSDGTISLDKTNIGIGSTNVIFLNPSGMLDPLTGDVDTTTTYAQKDAAYAFQLAAYDYRLAGQADPTIYENYQNLELTTPAGGSGDLTDEQIDENLLSANFNCDVAQGESGSCSIVDTNSNTTNYFNIGVATSIGSGTTDVIVTTQPLSGSSSATVNMSGSDIDVSAKDENVDASADLTNNIYVTGDTNNVTSASGVFTFLNGNGNTDQLGDNSTAVTTTGNTNNTLLCGTSSATIDGASTDVCSFAGGMSMLTLQDNGVAAEGLSGNITLTGSSDVVGASSNADITMASGDTVNVAAETSGVQLTCGSATETVASGLSGNDSVQCTISLGAGEFTNTGSDLEITNASVGSFSLDGNDNTFVDIATGTVTNGSSNINLSVAGSNNDVTMGNNSYLGLNSGTYNIFNLSDSTVVAQANTGATFNGSYDTVSSNSGNSLTFNGQNDTLTGNATTVALGAGSQFVATGTGDDFSLIDNSSTSLDVIGSTDAIVSAGNSLSFGANGSATVTGANNNVTLQGGNEALTVVGTGNTIGTLGNITDENLYCSGTTINDGISSSVVAYGNNDTTNLLSNSNSWFGTNGTGDVVNSIGNNISIGANTSTTINGQNQVLLWTNGTSGGGDNVTLSTIGDTVTADNGSNNDNLFCSGTTINDGGSSSVVAYGNNDTTNLLSNSNSWFGVNGTGDIINSSGNNVSIGANTNTTINGQNQVMLWTNGTSGGGDNVTLSTGGDGVTVDQGSTNDSLFCSSATVNAQSNVSLLVKGGSDTLTTDGGTFTLDGSGFTVNENRNSGNVTTDWLDASSSANIDGVNQSTNSSYLESLDYNGSAQETQQTQFSAGSGWELNDTNYNPGTGYDENQTIYGNILNGKDYETQYTDFNASGDAIQQDNWGTNTYLSDVLTSNGSTAYYTTGYYTDGDSADKYFQTIENFNGTTGAETQSDNYNAASGALNYVAFFDGGNYADQEDFADGSDPYFGQENDYNSSTGALESAAFYNGTSGVLQQVDLFDGAPYSYEDEFATGSDPYFAQLAFFNASNGKEEYSDSYNPTTGSFLGQTDYNGYSGSIVSDGSDGGYGDTGLGGYSDDGTGYFGGYYGYGGGYDGYDAARATSGTSKSPGNSTHGRFAAAGQIDQAIASANGVSGASASDGLPVQTASATSPSLSSAQQAALAAWSTSSLSASTSTSIEMSHATRAGTALIEPSAGAPDGSPRWSTNPSLPLASNLPTLLRAISDFGVAGDSENSDTAVAGPTFRSDFANEAPNGLAGVASNVLPFAPRSGIGPMSATATLSAAPNLHVLIHAMSAFGGARDGMSMDTVFARPILEDQHLLVMAN